MKKITKPTEPEIIKLQSSHVITVEMFYKKLQEKLKLKLVTPGVKLTRAIRSADIHRPGLAFSGYYDYFAYDRVQILGQTEVNYFNTLNEKTTRKSLNKFFTYKIPCLIISLNQKIPQLLLERAIIARVPIFRSPMNTSKLSEQITVFLEKQQAPEISVHGTLVDVYGVGILLLGKSGVGKSECALELIERGHRLVADDVIDIRLRVGALLMGYKSEIISHHMEIRGLGIINILDIFGVGAVRNQKRVTLVVTLERWNPRREYERLGLEEKRYRLLNIDLPHLIIPVRPGRNIPILIEVAALTQRAKKMGINPAQEFNKRLLENMNKQKEKQDD
ncbi:MAG: HPr(Ser) kinase/phosphatase [Candidatus Omnitrophica bacterium]|nr:HPr(Ser) kinase/phosphatase [Candidatus Omnitrophota bacterium]